MKSLVTSYFCVGILSIGCVTAQASECTATASFAKSWKTARGTSLKFLVHGTWSQQSRNSGAYTAISSVDLLLHYRVTWTDARGQEHTDARSGHTRYLPGGSGFSMQGRVGEFSTSMTEKFGSSEATMQIKEVSVDDIRCDTKA